MEGFKEGYESDVLESEMPEVSTAKNDDEENVVNASDEEESTKEHEEENAMKEDSDEDFNIDNYVALNKDFVETTAESSSIRYVLH